MKFTLNWLKEFVDFAGAPEALAKLLTMAGLEVEVADAVARAGNEREDWLFEIAVTPNRGDCLGIAGIAREVSRFDRCTAQSAAGELIQKGSGALTSVSPFRSKIPNSARAIRRGIVDDVKVRRRRHGCAFGSKPAASALLTMSSMSPTMSCSKPASRFMLSILTALGTRKSSCRSARDVKKFTTLDGVERELAADDLLICDGDVPVALAGVMGGIDSEVTDNDARTLAGERELCAVHVFGARQSAWRCTARLRIDLNGASIPKERFERWTARYG